MAGPFPPFALDDVLDAMRGFDRTWFLCGGWAVDCWLGRVSRNHGDVDLSVFDVDQRALYEHLAGWALIAHDRVLGGSTVERWDGHDLALPAHVHARRPGADPDQVDRLVTDASGDHGDDLVYEFIVNRRDGDDWVLRPSWAEEGRASSSDPVLRVPVQRAIRTLPSGIDAVAPEVLLVLKATSYRDDPRFPSPKTVADAHALVGALAEDEAAWAHHAIGRLAPPHPFVGGLPWPA